MADDKKGDDIHLSEEEASALDAAWEKLEKEGFSQNGKETSAPVKKSKQPENKLRPRRFY